MERVRKTSDGRARFRAGIGDAPSSGLRGFVCRVTIGVRSKRSCSARRRLWRQYTVMALARKTGRSLERTAKEETPQSPRILKMGGGIGVRRPTWCPDCVVRLRGYYSLRHGRQSHRAERSRRQRIKHVSARAARRAPRNHLFIVWDHHASRSSSRRQAHVRDCGAAIARNRPGATRSSSPSSGARGRDGAMNPVVSYTSIQATSCGHGGLT